jgi:hypothetical protein
LGNPLKEVSKESKGWGRQAFVLWHLVQAAPGEKSLRSLQPMAAPGQGPLWAHQQAISQAAGGREWAIWAYRGNLKGTPQNPLHSTGPENRLITIVFKNRSFKMTSHVHGFHSILSACTHWHVNPVC